MDDITNKRLADIEAKIEALEERVGGRFDKLGADVRIVKDDVTSHAAKLTSHVTAMEMRLSTAIMGLAGAIADVKAFMVERDQTQARLARIEEKLGLSSKQ